jgi:hypothetical protein
MSDDVWTVERHLADADPEVVALYHAFIKIVSGLGPVHVRGGEN